MTDIATLETEISAAVAAAVVGTTVLGLLGLAEHGAAVLTLGGVGPGSGRLGGRQLASVQAAQRPLGGML